MKQRPVVCVSCGREPMQPADEYPSSALGAEHLKVCPARDPYLLVPAWSVGWPYYWAVQDGRQAADDFTHEVAWMPAGNLTERVPATMIGSDPKLWHPHSPTVQAEIIEAALKDSPR